MPPPPLCSRNVAQAAGPGWSANGLVEFRQLGVGQAKSVPCFFSRRPRGHTQPRKLRKVGAPSFRIVRGKSASCRSILLRVLDKVCFLGFDTQKGGRCLMRIFVVMQLQPTPDQRAIFTSRFMAVSLPGSCISEQNPAVSPLLCAADEGGCTRLGIDRRFQGLQSTCCSASLDQAGCSMLQRTTAATAHIA